MIYEYVCSVCDHQLEIEQSIKAEPLAECPRCHVVALKRLVTGGAGFVLRGTGWYRDGYTKTGGDKVK